MFLVEISEHSTADVAPKEQADMRISQAKKTLVGRCLWRVSAVRRPPTKQAFIIKINVQLSGKKNRGFLCKGEISVFYGKKGSG
jgi:hypothetical protein